MSISLFFWLQLWPSLNVADSFRVGEPMPTVAYLATSHPLESRCAFDDELGAYACLPRVTTVEPCIFLGCLADLVAGLAP